MSRTNRKFLNAGRVAEGDGKEFKGKQGKDGLGLGDEVSGFLGFWMYVKEMVLVLEDFVLPDLH